MTKKATWIYQNFVNNNDICTELSNIMFHVIDYIRIRFHFLEERGLNRMGFILKKIIQLKKI